MREDVDEVLSKEGGVVLIEYPSLSHPERAFARIVEELGRRGIRPLIVDVSDTLHAFFQNLRFAGIGIDLSNVPVIKEKGLVKVGNVLGNVGVIEDFEYHLALYSSIAKKVPEESRRHTIVLGVEKFAFSFMNEPQKLERYFETVQRRYLQILDKTNFLFLNTDVASEYLKKGLEQDSDYVFRVEKGMLHPVKSIQGGV